MDARMQALFAKLEKVTRTEFKGCGRCKWGDLCADYIRLKGAQNGKITCKKVKTQCEKHNVDPGDWVGFLDAIGVRYYKRPIPQEQWEKENLIKVECKHCGKEFEIMKGDERAYCSAECVRRAKTKALAKKTCPICGKEFEFSYSARRTFCSKACFFQARRERMLTDNPMRKKGKAKE